MIRKVLLAGVTLLLMTGIAQPDRETQIEDTIVKQEPPQIPEKIEPPIPMDLTYEQQQDVFLYGVRSIDDQCKEQLVNLWCSDHYIKEHNLTSFDVVTISLQTKHDFRYTSDPVDNWRVHTSEVLMKQEWHGDCDDLASTTLDMMARAGHPLKKLWFVLADVRHKSMFDHLVGMVEDADGHFWIVGDTNAQNVYPVSEVQYRIVAIARADKPRDWVDPHTLDAFPAESLQSNPIVPEPKSGSHENGLSQP